MDKINIVLGVTGSVAAFKGAELASLLVKEGIAVHTIMTDAATKFITPLTFQSLTKQKVYTNMFEEIIYEDIRHISLAQRADVFVIAPASANIIGKIASGIADDMLSTVVMATKAPILICPAMNTAMYDNPIVQGNIAKLQALGYHFVEPKEALLACGDIGRGALQDPGIILGAIKSLLKGRDVEHAPTAEPQTEAPTPAPPIQHQYSLAEVENHLRNPEVARLFRLVDDTLASQLSDTDRKMYLHFYDELGLPVDVIHFMLKFCLERGKRGNSYLRTVAENWAEQGIDSIQEAEEYIGLFNNEYREILRNFGITARDPIPKEVGFMHRWLKEDVFAMPLIKLACEKTIMSTGKPNFPYADGILAKWKAENITTVEQAEALQQEYYDNVKKFKRPLEQVERAKPKPNKAQNYTGRTWDYDKLNRMERERIDRKVSE
ncbi:MAG: DnaD domain protein [Defluviitaleaceae bacterium]|nr:DnaD domain protein [Defluviitaleaceae bacterium]